MRFWGFFFLIVGVVTYFLPEIGNATIGRPIVFLPFHLLGENAFYAHAATAGLGIVMLIGSMIKRD